MIDEEDNFIHVLALGEELASQVIRYLNNNWFCFRFFEIWFTFGNGYFILQTLDAQQSSWFDKLSVACRVKRYRPMFASDFRQIGFRRDLQVEIVLTRPGNAFGFERYGQYYDVVRANWNSGKLKLYNWFQH
jgi:hypothetical protein